MARVLIVGNWNNNHITRFLRLLCNNKDESLELDAYDPCFENEQTYGFGVNTVYRIQTSWLSRKFFSIRKVGTFFLMKKRVNRLNEILRNKKYDLVNFHFLPVNINAFVNVCRNNNIPVLLTPLGSDVLRVNSYYKTGIIKAFKNCDYVSFDTSSGFFEEVCKQYSITKSKVVNLGYGSETITAIMNMQGRYTREELMKMLDVPYSNFNIVCGYNASIGQQHSIMIDGIIKNKDLLPHNYQVIIPLSYGQDREIIKKQIEKETENNLLNICYIERYLTIEQVAALRLVTDLFIHIQITDAFNASLQEFLLAGSTCINGGWLKYPSLETDGYPYIICDSLGDLPQVINSFLASSNNKKSLPDSVKNVIISNSWNVKIKDWIRFYNNI